MTTHAEAIKTLEKMLDDLRFQRRVSETSMLNGIETAIEAGIDAMKSKSDAETVMEWLKQNEGWTLGIAGEYGWLVVKETEPFEPDIPAPTLSELAAKLKELP